ncbi:thiocillin family RiPP [Bacillus stercoris]|uniref:Thiocillin family RiPP n=2 Tax=Bacillus TaxID=1386 RepID=A0ABT9DPQ7_9BACI|nr:MULTISPECIES: thiocillin family RiPP [Bacillus]AUS11362.1 thiocillin family RiPP [Bacillus subtilis]MCY7781427.1 thiocillin family RiPP [Bacillus sp. S20C3]MCY8288835.1 thiocillin family RiPP [Bacillus sp. N13C7]MCY8638260.1 thiocillin family RiPP [Bacillus sp. S17B2]MCY9142156.1 thiocillin family RiPP [Bacillus sp. T9C1]
MEEKKVELELFAEELETQMDFTMGPLSTWASATTVGSASCPGSTAGTASTASSLSG